MDEKNEPRLGRSLDDPHMRLMRAYAAQCGYLRPRAAELGIGPGRSPAPRHAAGRDRRSKAVTATERGRAAAEAWERVCDEEREAMLAGFSPEERVEFVGLLERARANLRAAARGEGGGR